MSYQPPGPYPGMPQYPGGVGLPSKPPMPESVRRAYFLMLAGAGLSVLSGVVALTETGSIRSALEKGLPQDDPDLINSLVTASIVAAIVGAVIQLGLWLWMAFAAKAGKNYARITGTVFFGIATFGTLFGSVGFVATAHNGSTSSTFASADTALGQVMSWLTFLVGLATVILLWRRSSGEYFKPEQYYAGPYGQPAGYPAGYGYPPAPGAQQPPYDSMPPQP